MLAEVQAPPAKAPSLLFAHSLTRLTQRRFIDAGVVGPKRLRQAAPSNCHGFSSVLKGCTRQLGPAPLLWA